MPACDTRLLGYYQSTCKPLFCITAKTACGYYLSTLLNFSLCVYSKMRVNPNQRTGIIQLARSPKADTSIAPNMVMCKWPLHVKKGTQFVLKTCIMTKVHCQVDVWLNYKQEI